jgi:hypothetical protein
MENFQGIGEKFQSRWECGLVVLLLAECAVEDRAWGRWRFLCSRNARPPGRPMSWHLQGKLVRTAGLVRRPQSESPSAPRSKQIPVEPAQETTTQVIVPQSRRSHTTGELIYLALEGRESERDACSRIDQAVHSRGVPASHMTVHMPKCQSWM